MHREPSSNLVKTNSSSRGSIGSRRREFPVENTPGGEGEDRRRTVLVRRSHFRCCRSRSHCRSWRNHCPSRCNCHRSRGNRGCDIHDFQSHDWRSRSCCWNNSDPADSWNWGLADHRLPAERQRAPGWRRPRGPGIDPLERQLTGFERCYLGICYIP